MKNIDLNRLQDGDIILFGGSNGFMGKTIRYFDDAAYTHIAIIVFVGSVPFVVDMWTQGISFVPLSKRLQIYPIFHVLRPDISQDEKKEHLQILFERWQKNKHIKYDYFLLPRIAIAKKLKIDFLAWGRESKYICSEFVVDFYAYYFAPELKSIKLITPQDFIRHQPKTLQTIK
jgi:hypothetical protein